MTSFCLDVRVLRSFVSVVETQSITETARRLGRTQPAITLQMKRLEDSLGKVLFRPDSRRPVLTDDGRFAAMPLCNAAKPNNGDVEKIMSSYYREPLMIVMDMTRAPAKLAMRRNGAEKLMRGESDWCGG